MTSPALPPKPTVVLAFSGGLDTSFCLLHLQHEHSYNVVTVTVDTGGFSPEALAEIEQHAHNLGAHKHITVDATDAVYDDHIAFLIQGNIRRGEVYPLCVGAERVVQARIVAAIASQLQADAVAHGSTGAGNDQIRFDVALRSLCPNIPIITPIRDLSLSRQYCTEWLAKHGVEIPSSTTTYSVNEGLWGVTIGGGETHDSWQYPPEEAFVWTCSPDLAPDEPLELTLSFEKGLPVALNDQPTHPVELLRTLNSIGGQHGVGRGIHVGDTILGIKGRIAFEAPAAAILLQAHRELEKIILTRWQSHWKSQLASFYGMLLHEAQYFDPVMRDLEAFLLSSQQRVTGDVRLTLHKGNLTILGVRSPFSMMDAAHGTYGEQNTLWSATDARGFCSIYGTQSLLSSFALQNAQNSQTHTTSPSPATPAIQTILQKLASTSALNPSLELSAPSTATFASNPVEDTL